MIERQRHFQDYSNAGDSGTIATLNLTETMNLNHNGRPHVLGKYAEVIGLTEDPYYIPLLKKRRASLDLDTIRRAANMPEEQLEATINSTIRSPDEAFVTLERAPAGEVQQ